MKSEEDGLLDEECSDDKFCKFSKELLSLPVPLPLKLLLLSVSEEETDVALDFLCRRFSLRAACSLRL